MFFITPPATANEMVIIKDGLINSRTYLEDTINKLPTIDATIQALDNEYRDSDIFWSWDKQHAIVLLWTKLNSLIQEKNISSTRDNILLEDALKAIADIDFYHPEWLPNFIDRDKDIYKCCLKLSQNAVSLWYDNQDPNSLASAIQQLKTLSVVTSKMNPNNASSKRLLGIALLALCIGATLCPTAIIGASFAATLLWAIMVITGGVGAHIYTQHPSPQGSKKLEQALSSLIDELSQERKNAMSALNSAHL